MTKKKLKYPYPTPLHNTHAIPPIEQREKSVKPVAFEELKSQLRVVMSDGYREKLSDGTWRTVKPLYHLKEWVRQGSKWAKKRA